MLDPRTAWRLLEEHLAPLAEETRSRRAARGRVLTRPLTATVDVPATDVSAMDGFALPGAPGAGIRWPVIGRVVAGDAPGFELPPGRAVRIMTGAPVPPGADRVVPVELTATDRDGDQETVRVLHPEQVPDGAHIRRRGEVLAAGDPLLPAGSPLTPGALALLAAHGIESVSVHRAPRVSVLVTGDELVPPGHIPAPGQLRDSHSDFLAAALADLGLSPQLLGIAPDDPGDLRARIAAGLAESDVLLLTGGVSMGELDLVEGTLAELGYGPLFTSVAVQPGKPLVAAVRRADSETPGARLVFGLPGNPGSVMVTFRLFVAPSLRRLMGHPDGFLDGFFTATLDAPLPGAKGRDRFLPATLRWTGDGCRVTPHPPRGSHDVAAFGRGVGLVRIPARSAPRQAGEPCEVLAGR